MKQKLITILLLSFWLSTSIAQSQFPPYCDIVTEFFQTYDLRKEQTISDIRFFKNQEGYFVQEFSKDLWQFHASSKFWDANKNKYKKNLDFPKANSDNRELSLYFCSQSDLYLFDLYPSYGYNGWPRDVINFYRDYENFSEDDLYAAGRAFSEAATNLLNNSHGFADSKNMFETESYGLNQLNEVELEEYLYFQRNSIQYFADLCDRNPLYSTIVGNICNKYYNQILTGFLELRMYQNEHEAGKLLTDGLYSDMYLDFAKNLLNSCDSNAILFTFGDNDTYPLLYTQIWLHFRKDVLVINLNLLNLTNYVNHFRYGKILDADSLNMIFSPDSYANDNLQYTILKTDPVTEEFVNLSYALELIESQDSLTLISNYPEYKYLISNKLIINMSDSNQIYYTLQKDFLYKNELLLFDIIQSNIADRPVYFSTWNDYLNLEDFYILNGIAYRLSDTSKLDHHLPNFGFTNSGKTFKQLIHDFYFHPDEENLIHSDKKLSVVTYQHAFLQLATYYSQLGYPDSCKIIINRYLELFPNSYYEFDQYMIPFIMAAWDVDLHDECNVISATIIDNLQDEFENGETTSDQKENLIRIFRTLQRYITDENLSIKLNSILIDH